jgi:hypothetical protein
MGREDKIAKEFSEYLDRILAGEDVVIGAEASEELRTALDFARRLKGLCGEPSPAFKEELKRDLLRKLAEQDAAATRKSTRPFWRFTWGRVVTAATAVAILIIAIAIWQYSGIFQAGSPSPATSTATAPASTTMATVATTTAAPTALPAPTAAPTVVPAPTTTRPATTIPALTSTKVEPRPGDTVISAGGLMVPLSIDDLIKGADVILVGRVAGILPSKQGDNQLQDDWHVIYTDVIIQTENYLYGQPPAKRIAVRVEGGRVGDTVMLVEDAPVFYLGEDVALFLERLAPENTTPDGIAPEDYYRVYGGIQGKYAYADGAMTGPQGKAFTVAEIEDKIAEIRPGEQ